MVQAPHLRRNLAPAVKTTAAFSVMNGLTQIPAFHEVQFFQGVVAIAALGAADNRTCKEGGNLFRHAHLDEMTRLIALHQPQDTARDQPAHRPARRPGGEANTASEPVHGKLDAPLSFEPAVTEEMRIDSAVHWGQAQARRKNVLELFPHLSCIESFVFHDLAPE